MKYCNPYPYHIRSISCLFKVPAIAKKERFDNVDVIIKTVCKYCNVTEQQMYSKKRTRDIVEARSLAMHFIKLFNNNLTLTTIGKIFGGMHHSSIIYSINTVGDLLQSKNKTFTSKHEFIKDRLIWLNSNTDKEPLCTN